MLFFLEDISKCEQFNYSTTQFIIKIWANEKQIVQLEWIRMNRENVKFK